MRLNLDDRVDALRPYGRAAKWVSLTFVIASLVSLEWPGVWTPAMLSIAGLLMALAVALGGRGLEPGVFVLGFAASNCACWTVGLVGASVVLDSMGLSFGGHSVLSAWLGALSSWSIVVVLWFALRGRRGEQRTERTTRRVERDVWRRLKLFFGTVYAFYVLVGVLTGVADSRWTVGNRYVPGSALYFVNALGGVCYPFFFFLGAGLAPKRTGYLVTSLATVAAAIIGSGVTGGREFGVFATATFLFGACYSELRTRHLVQAVLLGIPTAALFMVGVGLARGSAGFEDQGAADRVRTIVGSARGGQGAGESGDEPAYVVFTRVAMPQAQLVVDDVVESRRYVGMVNFDRIPSFFVPKFINPNKKEGDDAWDRLIANHGFVYDPYSSPPLSVLADAFERFGVEGVAGFTAMLAITLLLTNALILRYSDPMLRFAVLSSLLSQALLVAQKTVLGTLQVFSYALLRETIIFATLLFIARSLGVYRLSEVADSTELVERAERATPLVAHT